MPLPADSFSNVAIRNDQRQRVIPAQLVTESWTDAVAADPNGYSATHAGAGAAGTTEQTLGGALAGVADFARNVVVTVTHGSSVVAMSGVITGTDVHGNGITEAWAVTATGTSKVFTGLKAFKTVTSITEVVVADASGNSIISGSGDKLGLSQICAVASLVKEISGGSVVTNGTTVAGSTVSTADRRGTYAPNTVPDGAVDFEIYYLVNDLYHTK